MTRLDPRRRPNADDAMQEFIDAIAEDGLNNLLVKLKPVGHNSIPTNAKSTKTEITPSKGDPPKECSDAGDSSGKSTPST